jgi:hypothetical protein
VRAGGLKLRASLEGFSTPQIGHEIVESGLIKDATRFVIVKIG